MEVEAKRWSALEVSSTAFSLDRLQETGIYYCIQWLLTLLRRSNWYLLQFSPTIGSCSEPKQATSNCSYPPVFHMTILAVFEKSNPTSLACSSPGSRCPSSSSPKEKLSGCLSDHPPSCVLHTVPLETRMQLNYYILCPELQTLTNESKSIFVFKFCFLLNLLEWHWLIKLYRFHVQFYNTSSVHCIVCSPHKIKSPSITIYLPIVSSISPIPLPPFPSGNHHSVVCIYEGFFFA